MNQLRPYQVNLINQLRKAYKTGSKRPCLVLPCGGGKSIITAEIAKKATQKGNRVLYLVHRRELVEQIFRTFADWGVDLSLCDIKMVQTACRRFHSMPEPRLIITDENHHCVAKTYRKIYEAFPAAQCLGVTATPIRLNGGGLGDVNDKLVVGVSAKWLIENNYLAPYDYYAPSVADLSGLRTSQGEYVGKDAEIALDTTMIYGDVTRHYRKLADGKKAICYCPTVNYSKKMAARFCEVGIPAAHIDGTTKKKIRDDVISQFRAGDIQILCNVDLISEGFDVPDCSCAILLRPTQSLTLYIQQSMRCMRYQPGKRAVIIDHVGNYTRFGMPDDDREWSLKPKRDKKEMVEKKERIKQCPECFYTFFASVGNICPKCGYEFEPKKEIEELPESQLTQVTGFKLDYEKTPSDCKTYQELRMYAAARHYKPGWAYYQAKARGFIA